MRSSATRPRLLQFLLLLAVGFHVTAAIECGNGQQRCGYTEGEGHYRERCEFNTWKKKECCGRCDTIDQANSDIDCNKPHGFTDGKCPLISLGGDCQYRQECASVIGKGTAFCVRGTCQIGQGTTGEACEPGVSRCQTDQHVCSTTHKKCLYAFRGPCFGRLNKCDNPPEMSPNTTMQCRWDLYAGNAPAGPTLCIPILRDGSECLSEVDCARGPCVNGACTENPIPRGGKCDIYGREYCSQGNVCRTTDGKWYGQKYCLARQ